MIESDRGSRFVLCERSRTDARFAKFPTVPVRACGGFEPSDQASGPDESGSGVR
jgi:hypothetical protein